MKLFAAFWTVAFDDALDERWLERRADALQRHGANGLGELGWHGSDLRRNPVPALRHGEALLWRGSFARTPGSGQYYDKNATRRPTN